jgi:glycosyltransferase involved in cell wall biosynthesis
VTDLAVIMSVCKNDRLAFVKESVLSILCQTFSLFHYYIILDGPVAPEISLYLNSLSDSRIRLFRLEKNGGLARALNFLLEIILKNPGYTIIARMDADDISFASRLEKQHKYLADNQDISCVGCWFQEIDESGRYLYDRKLPVGHEALRKRYFTRTPFPHPAVMYRRNLIETAGLYPTDTILMEDNVLWGIALKNGFKFGNIPEYLLKFRIDRNFYKRRSGIRYGWNYMITKFRVNKMLHTPVYVYLISFGIGVMKMIPFFILKHIYYFLRD